jgi:hypothetical protein
MSTLSKDWKYQVETIQGSSSGSVAAQPGYYAEEKTTVLNTSPIVAPSTTTIMQSAADVFTTSAVKVGSGYIRFATWDEINKLHKMQGVSDANSATVLSGIIFSTLENGVLGNPLLLAGGMYTFNYSYTNAEGNFILSPNTYLSVWLIGNRAGIFTFYGYTSASDRPTKNVTYNNGIIV